MASYGWAYDDGYSDSKSLIRLAGGVREAWKIPSYKTGWRDIELTDAMGNLKYSSNPDQYIAVEFLYNEGNALGGFDSKHLRYLLGEVALRQDLTIQWNGSYDKHVDVEHFMSHFLAHMARAAYLEDEFIIEPLLLAIPTEVYMARNQDGDYEERMKRIEVFKKMLLGKHHQVTLRHGHNKIIKRCFVKDLEVYQQPFGGALDLMIDDHLRPRQEYAGKKILVVDWGGKTMNVFMSNGIEEVIDYCAGYPDLGWYWVIQELRKVLTVDYDRKLTDGQVYRFIREGGIIQGLNVNTAVNQLEAALFDRGMAQLHKLLDNVWSTIDVVRFVGGTSMKFQPKIKTHFTREISFGDEYSVIRGLDKLARMKNFRRTTGR